MKKLALAVAITSVAAANAANALHIRGDGWHLDSWFTEDQGLGQYLYLYGGSGGSWIEGNDIHFQNGPGNSFIAEDSNIRATGWVAGVTWMTDINMSNWVISGGGTSTGTFTCTEGAFGGQVGASICGDYNFGTGKNGNESTYNATTGISTLGGNDISIADAGSHISGNDYWGQSINDLSGLTPWLAAPLPGGFYTDFIVLTTRSINKTTQQLQGDGHTLTFITSLYNACETEDPELYDPVECEGYPWDEPDPEPPVASVPLPAAAWLFGSALIGLAGSRSRRKK